MSDNNIPQDERETPIVEKTLEQLEHQVEDLTDRLLRTMAESENIRRRYEKQIEEIKDYSITSFAKDLISVLDNLDMAIKFQPKNPSDDVKNILDGVVMTHKELNNILSKHGITIIEPKSGDKFDYNLHFAISQAVHEEIEKDHIVGLMQVGYKIKDRLLRPASVSVAKEK
jgi:molecular chaperone GrpE